MRKSENEDENHHPYEKRFVFVFVLRIINKEGNISALGKKLCFVVSILQSMVLILQSKPLIVQSKAYCGVFSVEL